MLCYSCPRSKCNLRIYYYPIFSALIIARLRIILSIRLEQVDIDGCRTIETEIVDLLRSSNEQTVMVFPNPGKDLLTIQFQTKQCADIAINLLDLNGHIVQRNSSTSSPGVNHRTIDTNGLADGIYVIQLYTNKVILFSDTIRKTH